MTMPTLPSLCPDDLSSWLDSFGHPLLAEKSSVLLSLHPYLFEEDPETGLPTERALSAFRAASDLRIHLSVYNLVSSCLDSLCPS